MPYQNNANSNYSDHFQNSYSNNYPSGNNPNPEIQALLHKAPLSASFILSSVSGGIIAILMVVFLIIASVNSPLQNVNILSALSLLVVLIPALLFLIGQYVFIINSASNRNNMPTSGMTVMQVGAIMQAVYTVIGMVAYLIMDLVWINEFNDHVKDFKGRSYYRRHFGIDISRSDDVTAVRIILWSSLFIVLIVSVLDFIAYIRTVKSIFHSVHEFPVSGCSRLYQILLSGWRRSTTGIRTHKMKGADFYPAPFRFPCFDFQLTGLILLTKPLSFI